WTGAVAADPSLMNGTTNWTNASGTAGAFDVDIVPGVRAFITPDPVGAADADSDGMPDGWETAEGFNPANAGDAALDADADGLSNLREYLAGTDPHAADSDGD